ncbi:MAG: hypothetical protein ACOCRK_03115 [bacterium]
MKLKVSYSTIKESYIALVIFATVLMSKTYYFGVANRSIFQYVYYILAMGGVVIVGFSLRTVKKNILIVFIMLFLLGFNMLFYLSEMTLIQVNSVLGNMFLIISAAITSTYISKRQFAFWYIKIIGALCIISLPFFLLANIAPDLARTFFLPGYDWQVPVGYSMFYTWGWNGQIFPRNAGPFWEPGAFQGFIMVGILLLLFNVDNQRIKKRKMHLIILLFTLITTQSSTGYILFVFILVTQWSKIQRVFGDINKWIRFLAVFTLSVASLYIILRSGNIIDKFTNVNNTNSAQKRFSDIMGGLSLIYRGGIIGLGETMTRDRYKALVGIGTNDSVGLFSMTYTYGISFAIVYIFGLFRGLKKIFVFNKFMDKVVLLIIFIILHLTEGLWWLPVYLIFIFLGEDEYISCGGRHLSNRKNFSPSEKI